MRSHYTLVIRDEYVVFGYIYFPRNGRTSWSDESRCATNWPELGTCRNENNAIDFFGLGQGGRAQTRDIHLAIRIVKRKMIFHP